MPRMCTLRISARPASYNSPYGLFAGGRCIVDVPAPGTPHDVPFTHMHGAANATVRLPKQGDGVAGVVIADPCVADPHGSTALHAAALVAFE